VTTLALPEIRTERLCLRLARAEDAASIAAFHLRNAAHVHPWFPTPPEGFYTAEFQRSSAEADRAAAEDLTRIRLWAFPLDAPEAPAGMLHIRDITFGESRRCELGYIVDVGSVGSGLATEMAEAGVRYCFDELRLHRIEACYMPANTGSARVLAKLGFEFEGVLRGLVRVNGVWEDHVLASLLNPGMEYASTAMTIAATMPLVQDGFRVEAE
jgi:ribosomal-protein-alanine N-acetyltransferase